MPPTRDLPYGLSFSADSNYIYYAQLSYDTQVLSLSKISVVGGAPKKLIENMGRAQSFAQSPDGKQIAFVRFEANGVNKLLLTNEDGTGERLLATLNNTTEWFASAPAWSPDGKTIACLVGSSVGGYNVSPLAINVADGAQRKIGTAKWTWATSIVWLNDGNGLLAGVGESSTAPRQVWYISYPEGATRRVTNDLNDYWIRSVTADSRTLLAVQTNILKDIWVAPVSGDTSQLKQVTFTTQDEVRGHAWTPDGKILFFSAEGAGKLNLWVMNADGSDRRQITSGTGEDYNPVPSPDGRFIFFTSTGGGGTPHIWRVDVNGSNLKQLTFGDIEDTQSKVTPDGKWVLFNSYRSGALSVWKIAVEGGEPIPLNKSLAVMAISPDGKLMACLDQSQQSGRTKIFILPVEGGEPVKVLELPQDSYTLTFGWTADGRAITFLHSTNGIDNFWTLPLDGGQPVQLTHFNDPSLNNFGSFALSRDGKQLAVTRTTRNTTLVLITDFK
jgi:Tol biopolymer transport system component